MIRLIALVASPILLSAAALAGTDVSVPHFTDVAARAGAEVKLVYGPAQRVTVLEGDLNRGRIEVKDGHRLEIAGCDGMFCWGNHKLVIEVVTPQIEAVMSQSGAQVTASGTFPKQAHLRVQAHSGGSADTRAIPGETVDAQVSSGGDADVQALSTLNAGANSGGDIRYMGHPAKVNAQSHSGGGISTE
jgi:hypothetical protein